MIASSCISQGACAPEPATELTARLKQRAGGREKRRRRTGGKRSKINQNREKMVPGEPQIPGRDRHISPLFLALKSDQNGSKMAPRRLPGGSRRPFLRQPAATSMFYLLLAPFWLPFGSPRARKSEPDFDPTSSRELHPTCRAIWKPLGQPLELAEAPEPPGADRAGLRAIYIYIYIYIFRSHFGSSPKQFRLEGC